MHHRNESWRTSLISPSARRLIVAGAKQAFRSRPGRRVRFLSTRSSVFPQPPVATSVVAVAAGDISLRFCLLVIFLLPRNKTI